MRERETTERVARRLLFTFVIFPRKHFPSTQFTQFFPTVVFVHNLPGTTICNLLQLTVNLLRQASGKFSNSNILPVYPQFTSFQHCHATASAANRCTATSQLHEITLKEIILGIFTKTIIKSFRVLRPRTEIWQLFMQKFLSESMSVRIVTVTQRSIPSPSSPGLIHIPIQKSPR